MYTHPDDKTSSTMQNQEAMLKDVENEQCSN